MEFRGIARVNEIGARRFPWNSMELLVSAKLAHFKFHGIPWKSMELLVSAKLTQSKLHGTARVSKIGAPQIPWNCWCQRNWRTWSSMEFLGIPWNCSCHRNWHTLTSMEFHGTARVNEIGAPQVPRNSMDLLVSAKLPNSKFHGIPCNSIDLLMSAKLAHLKFHGTARVNEIGSLQVPWTPMELLVSDKIGALQFPWNSMESYGTARVSEIGALQVPWNSMELLVSAKLTHSKFHGISWNCSCQRNWRTPSSMEFHVIARVSEIGAPQIPWNSMEVLLSSKLAPPKFDGFP